MRIVNSESELEDAYQRAKSEAENHLGIVSYVETIDQPKHIEVQIIGMNMVI